MGTPALVIRQNVKKLEGIKEKEAQIVCFYWLRTLQPVLNQPTVDVLTYEALRYRSIHAQKNQFFFLLGLLLKVLSSSRRWAWCSVNTRSVYMSRPSSNFLSGPDNYVLAPFLDLLNHRPDVQVKLRFPMWKPLRTLVHACFTALLLPVKKKKSK